MSSLQPFIEILLGLFLLSPLAAAASNPAQGPLRVHPENPRYFTDGTKLPDGSLKAVYLTGSHTWANLIDRGPSDPPPIFDFDGYLDFLAQHDHNFIRLWEELSVDLKSGRYRLEWFDAVTGESVGVDQLESFGGPQRFELLPQGEAEMENFIS